MKCLPAAYELPFAGSKINGKDIIGYHLFYFEMYLDVMSY
jgi:hypothetical protein